MSAARDYFTQVDEDFSELTLESEAELRKPSSIQVKWSNERAGSSIDFVDEEERGVISAPSIKGEPQAHRPIIEVNRHYEWESIAQSWEGRVVYNDPNESEFVAVIRDLTAKDNPDEEVVIGYESVLESDRALISEGSVFFWNVGRQRKISSDGRGGPSVNKFEIRFRRLPPLGVHRVQEIRRLSKDLAEELHGNQSA